MSALPAIRAQGLGRRYAIAPAMPGFHETLREAWMRRLRARFGGGAADSVTDATRTSRAATSASVSSASRDARDAAPLDIGAAAPLEVAGHEEFWALRDLTFEVARGERLAMLGANGAGKSTLLRVLARITEPSEGRVEIRGRVASLLEVGTGFHPDLTGRENIRLNGAILGIPQREVRRRFDEIVEFAGIGRFLDTPVRHYSSGMHLRLAFAVATTLESDILLVDEVLAVGDAGFRAKCLARMDEIARGGRTVVLVSHDLGAVRAMCDTAIVLERGRLVFRGPVDEAAALHLASFHV